jgi:hypothetical protein
MHHIVLLTTGKFEDRFVLRYTDGNIRSKTPISNEIIVLAKINLPGVSN